MDVTSNVDQANKLAEVLFKRVGIAFGISLVAATIAGTVVQIKFFPKLRKPRAGSGQEAAVGVRAETSSLSLGKIDTILERNIFNTGVKLKRETSSKDKTMRPELLRTNLPIKLIGTISAGDPHVGMATIQDVKTKSINSFYPGDPIKRRVVVWEIYRQQVVINNDGAMEVLEFEEEKSVLAKRPKVANTIATIAEGKPKEYEEKGLKVKGTQVTMTLAYKENLRKDLGKVLQAAKAIPVEVDGQIVGFRLVQVDPNSIYGKLQLEENDIVKAVNGTPLTSPTQAIGLLRAIEDESEYEIVVERGGATMNLNIKVL